MFLYICSYVTIDDVDISFGNRMDGSSGHRFSLVACSTSGIERFFQMVGKWTSDIFMFESQDIENSGNDERTW